MDSDRSHHDDKAPASIRRSAGQAAESLGGAEAPAHPLLRLQRQVGNAQVARMLAQRVAPEEEEEEGKIQASPEVGLQGGPVSDALASRINAQRGGGSPLDDSLRTDMEGALGASFEDVRVHGDTESHHLNRSISAKAFTTGSDIFLGQEANANDHSLMAHELTHVVQQRSMSASGPMTVGPAGDDYERQADATAAQATQVQRDASAEPEEQ